MKELNENDNINNEKYIPAIALTIFYHSTIAKGEIKSAELSSFSLEILEILASTLLATPTVPGAM